MTTYTITHTTHYPGQEVAMTIHLNLTTTGGYRRALEALNLTPFGNVTGDRLGLKKRQLARLAAGSTKPSATLQRLLEALIELKAR